MASLPILEIVRCPSHDGRVVVVLAKSEIALVAEEIAQLAGLVVVIDAEIFLAGLQADDTDAALSEAASGGSLCRRAIVNSRTRSGPSCCPGWRAT